MPTQRCTPARAGSLRPDSSTHAHLLLPRTVNFWRAVSAADGPCAGRHTILHSPLPPAVFAYPPCPCPLCPSQPLVLERLPVSEQTSWRHTKSLYRLTDESMHALRGCTSDMCSTDHLPRKRTKVSTRLL